MKDHSLIERIKSKQSDKALKEVYQKYRNEFLHWAVRNHSCTMEEAKDIFQQGVVILYENVKLGKVTQITTQVKTYLFSICKNKLLEMHRKKSKTQANYNDQIFINEEFYFSSVTDDFEEKISIVEECLQEMGDPCKGILEQYYYHKRSMVEISELLDYKNSDTVKNLKYKCLQRLKQYCKSKLSSF